MATPETAHNAKERFEKQIDSCIFGDDKIKRLFSQLPGYRVQSLHHSVVLQVDYVLFVVADSSRINDCLLIAFPHCDRMIYKVILDDYRVQHLKPICDDGVEQVPCGTRDRPNESGLAESPQQSHQGKLMRSSPRAARNEEYYHACYLQVELIKIHDECCVALFEERKGQSLRCSAGFGSADPLHPDICCELMYYCEAS